LRSKAAQPLTNATVMMNNTMKTPKNNMSTTNLRSPQSRETYGRRWKNPEQFFMASVKDL